MRVLRVHVMLCRCVVHLLQRAYRKLLHHHSHHLFQMRPITPVSGCLLHAAALCKHCSQPRHGPSPAVHACINIAPHPASPLVSCLHIVYALHAATCLWGPWRYLDLRFSPDYNTRFSTTLLHSLDCRNGDYDPTTCVADAQCLAPWSDEQGWTWPQTQINLNKCSTGRLALDTNKAGLHCGAVHACVG